MTDKTVRQAEAVARAIAAALGDNFDDAFAGKQEWINERGFRGGRYRDVNEPFQADYLCAAQAAIAALESSEPPELTTLRAQLAERDAEIARIGSPELADHEAETALVAEGIRVWGPDGERFQRMFASVMKARAALEPKP